eukprot:1024163-Karenia_brevis.AAC.1
MVPRVEDYSEPRGRVGGLPKRPAHSTLSVIVIMRRCVEASFVMARPAPAAEPFHELKCPY